MSRIHVGVIYRSDCKNLIMRYVDPVTGRWSTSTKYRDPQTGIETANAYYVDLNADEIAEDLYRVSGQAGAVSGTVAPADG